MNYIAIALLAGIVYGCTEENISGKAGTEIQVTGNVGGQSRTAYSVGEGSVYVSWVAGDKIGLFSEGQPDQMCYQAVASGKRSDFMPEGSRLDRTEGDSVYAYYPYSDPYSGSVAAGYPYAPLPYLFGQNYNNGLPAPESDFMYAKGEIRDGVLDLDFKHLFAFLKLNIRTELLKEAQGLFVQSEEQLMYMNAWNEPARFDFRGDSLVAEKCDYLWYYVPKEALDTLETVTCCMAVLPTSENNLISFFIHGDDGSIDHGLIERKAPEGGFKAGHVYDLSVEDNEFDRVVQQEKEALIALYEATGGENWTDNTNWCSDKPLEEWYGVGFWGGHVRYLSLGSNNLSGQIPEQLAELPALYYLNLSFNQLSGTIPSFIANLPMLQSLYLHYNKFDGSIPEWIGKLEKLTNLYLSGNQLTGTVPSSIGNLKSLLNLDLSFNQLTGSIPSSIGNLVSLESLNIQYNKLDGSVPEEIGKLEKLTSLYLSGNQLTGTVPSSIGNLRSLSELDLTDNQLSGSLPSTIGNLTSLKFLYFRDNGLSGTIPSTIGNLTSLEYLDLSDNELTGNLPVSMAALNSLENINLCGNRLNGVIPDEIVACDWWNRLGYNTVIYQKGGNRLSFSMYESSDYSMDGTIFTLQRHTAGKGLKLVILGEAYSDRLIADGTYREDAEAAMEAFFSEEPYTSFRNYFDVYGINVVSCNEVLGENTAFQTSYEFDRNTFETNPAKAVEYISRMAETNYTAADVTSIVLMNTDAGFRSNCWMYSDGFSAAFCKVGDDEGSLRSLIHHEVCGHGFGKLADEYTEFEGVYPYPESIPLEHAVNESMNVDVTDNPQEVIWSYFLTDMRYAKEGIGIFEGALYYPKGAYRATENSIMRYNTGGFNAPSRQSIYRRIMEKSGGAYSFEAFLEYDEINRNRIESGSRSGNLRKGPVGLPPVKCNYPSSEAKRHWKKDSGTIPFR